MWHSSLHAVLLQAETWHPVCWWAAGASAILHSQPSTASTLVKLFGNAAPFLRGLQTLAWLIFLEHLWTLSQWTSPVTTLPGMLPALPRLAFVIVCFA